MPARLMEPTLIHVTMATGHWRPSPRSEVSDDAIQAVRPLLHEGGSLPTPSGYELKWTAPPATGACVYSVFRSGERPIPLVTCGVARDEAAAARLWPVLFEMQRQTMKTEPQASRPIHEPWCGVVLLPTLGFDTDAVEWLGDFERVIAWAWLEEEGGAS